MKDDDTDIGGATPSYPATRESLIARLKSDPGDVRTRAWDGVISSYWKPVYQHIRHQWRRSNEDAKDLTQSFFARAFEKDFFKDFDPARARFRTYLRSCLDGFLAGDYRAAKALKRGGGAPVLQLDFDTAEREFAQRPDSQDRSPANDFDAEWTRSIFAGAIEDFRERCVRLGRLKDHEVFTRYDLAEPGARPTYETIGAALGIAATSVTNHLASARREFRSCVLARLRAVTASEEEFRDEVRAILGSFPS